MIRVHRRVLLATAIAVGAVGALSACGEQGVSKAPVSAPSLGDGKADGDGTTLSATLNDRGRLSFGGEASGDLVTEGQLDAYLFTAEAGAVVTLDNSHRGTTSGLDSTLFLYGPLDGDGRPAGEPIAFDDDSGWGRHARIAAFELPARGDYLAVIGTYAGLDSGHYRLTLSCDGDRCAIPCDAACHDEDPCSGWRCDPTDGCVREPAPSACGELGGEPPIVVSAGELMTSEARDSDTFTVRLTEAPSDHVIVWVDTSDPSEGEPFPSKLVFCAPGYVPDPNGCVLAEDPAQLAGPPDWSREVEVTVFGVRDALDDGDVDYRLSFTVESEDPRYAAVSLDEVACVNIDDPTPLDYSDLDGLSDDALLAALHDRVSGHTAYGYLGQNSVRTLMFSTVDVHGGRVESLYSGATIAAPRDATRAYRAGFNTEHTWPQGQFDKLEPMKSDLHHIFPTDAHNNSLRSSYDFGITAAQPDATGSVLGTSELGSDLVFQVRPERRGDVARAHFYMVARYASAQRELGVSFDDDKRASNGAINDREEAVLRRWNLEDPVDQRERDRNDRVEAYQGNRNPFVDRPDLVARISDF